MASNDNCVEHSEELSLDIGTDLFGIGDLRSQLSAQLAEIREMKGTINVLSSKPTATAADVSELKETINSLAAQSTAQSEAIISLTLKIDQLARAPAHSNEQQFPQQFLNLFRQAQYGHHPQPPAHLSYPVQPAKNTMRNRARRERQKKARADALKPKSPPPVPHQSLRETQPKPKAAREKSESPCRKKAKRETNSLERDPKKSPSSLMRSLSIGDRKKNKVPAPLIDSTSKVKVLHKDSNETGKSNSKLESKNSKTKAEESESKKDSSPPKVKEGNLPKTKESMAKEGKAKEEKAPTQSSKTQSKTSAQLN